MDEDATVPFLYKPNGTVLTLKAVVTEHISESSIQGSGAEGLRSEPGLHSETLTQKHYFFF